MDGVRDRRMAPGRLHQEFLGGVLSVVDDEIRPVTQFEHALVDVVRVSGLLMVAHESYGGSTSFDPEPERRSDVGNLSHDDLRVADDHILVEGLFQADVAFQTFDVYRKERRMKDTLEDIVKGASVLGGSVDVELCQWAEYRREEGKTDDVVP